MSLLKLQRNALSPILSPQGQDSQWKILIFDTHCQSILSTLYRVGELRELCITLHVNINSKRDRLHGVLAIYFLQPTSANVRKLQEDLQADLYSHIIVNFSSPLADDLIEQFAKALAGTKAFSRIHKVFEHNTDFTSLHHNLFTFNIPNSYNSVNPLCIATHLCSLLHTLKMQPLILYRLKKEPRKRQSQTQLVAERLAELYAQLDSNFP